MKSSQPPHGDSSDKLDRFVNKFLAPLALIGGLLLILWMTLWAFHFRYYPLNFRRYFGGFLYYPSSFLDFPLNIILFMPFGFGLASMLEQARLSRRTVFYSIFLAGFLLTWFVETLQFFLPGRTPNVADLVANTLGALLGWGCYRLWQNRPVIINETIPALSKPRYLMLGLTVYLIILGSLGLLLRERARIGEWRPPFPLLIGNEQTGNRAWEGTVKDLVILDRALVPAAVEAFLLGDQTIVYANSALVAHYPLDDSAALSDQAGNLPDLEWKGYTAITAADDIPSLNGRNWLKSESPAAYLTGKLQESSQFTIILSIATYSLEQGGPARIVSVSASPFFRNLTLGQEDHALVARVRTPLTGFNGTFPELKILDQFNDFGTHQLVVTYDGLGLAVYSDQAQSVQKVDIVPAAALFYTLYDPFARTVALTPMVSRILMVLFYLLAFIPVGIIMALLVAQIPSRVDRLIFLALGITVPALILEAILTAPIGFQLRLVNVMLSAAITVTTFLILASPAHKLLNDR